MVHFLETELDCKFGTVDFIFCLHIFSYIAWYMTMIFIQFIPTSEIMIYFHEVLYTPYCSLQYLNDI